MTHEEYKEELQKNVQKLHSEMNKDMQLVVTYGLDREDLAKIRTVTIIKNEFGFLMNFLLKGDILAQIPVKEGRACDTDVHMIVDPKSIRYIVKPVTSLDSPHWSNGKYTFEIVSFKTVRKSTIWDTIVLY